MQGIVEFIPTKNKVEYLQALLNVGFHTLDFGSFVSPKAIPQLRDTAEVLDKLDLSQTRTKLLAIVANLRGAETAVQFDKVAYVGYPFSISETFQLRNTNKTIAQSFDLVKQMQALCTKHGKTLVVYFSMGFGNPYGEEWNVEIVEDWARKMHQIGVRIISLSDTIGTSSPESIEYLFSKLIPAYPEIEFGAHLHTTPSTWFEKIETAFENGCRRFDGAVRGYGGCPMADNKLVGNMPTENLISFCTARKLHHGINTLAFESAYNIALEIFKEK